MTTAHSVGDLAALLTADPGALDKLDPEEARALLIRASALVVQLAVRAASAPPAPPPGEGDSSRNGHEAAVWLNVSQVGSLYGLSATWLSEHSRELERVPNLVCKASRKVRLYRAATLRRWLDARTVA